MVVAIMTNGNRRLVVFALFTVVTLIMTYPLVFHLGTSLRDLGDPLLNSWILSWNVHKITHLDLKHYFDTNIFYPQKRTLAYSEHLFPQSLAALPVWLISKNPVLAHNLVFLLAFLTAGLGMYALARYLVKNDFAAVVAGLIYAFSPFMFAHLSQLQVATAGGIPLALLFLHKFFESNRRRDVLLFSFFYVLQFLANGYYGMFLTLFSGLLIVILTISKKRYKEGRFWANLGLFLLIALVFIGPFLYQYVLVRKEMGFAREPGLSASLRSFLATASINRLYGRITAPFLRPEGELFPGLAALALAVLGLFSTIRTNQARGEPGKAKKPMPSVLRFVHGLILFATVVTGILCVLIAATGGWEISVIRGLKFHAHSLTNPLLVFCVLLALSGLLNRKYRVRRRTMTFENQGVAWIYSGILLLSFLFTLGSQGPYLFLYKYVPGFNGLRVPSRFHIFVMLSLSIFAAFGIKKLFLSRPNLKRFLAQVLIVLLILVEYASMPLPLKPVAVKNEIPEVYRWLAAKKDDVVMVELPLPYAEKGVGLTECLRVYYSIYHWKKMVNGYSGYFPQIYSELCRRWKELPLAQNMADLQTLGVNLVMIHSAELSQKEIRLVLAELQSLQIDVQTVAIFGTDYVLAVPPGTAAPAGPVWKSQVHSLLKDGWNVDSSVNQKMAPLAIDGSLESRWESGPQRSGLSFTVDMKKPEIVQGISLKLGRSSMDYPRGYIAEISMDGFHWEKVAGEEKTILPILAFLNPQDLALDIPLGGKEARFIRITDTGEDPTYYWSIYEIEVFK
jgi:F5/8 type C domain/6-pyruvoyl-tetrahydropterin synthase related domain